MSNISNLEDYRTPTPSTKNSKVINTRKYKDVREREYLNKWGQVHFKYKALYLR